MFPQPATPIFHNVIHGAWRQPKHGADGRPTSESDADRDLLRRDRTHLWAVQLEHALLEGGGHLLRVNHQAKLELALELKLQPLMQPSGLLLLIGDRVTLALKAPTYRPSPHPSRR